ncbi:hypothetical protein B0H19DRAFT_1100530 [Mycena capillaripes]|nr:hypothetical protein B0H19DRAFT_1100530 [Mycena capillaripes]
MSRRTAFACDFPGCLKKFGVPSNLQRHRVVHGIQRRGRPTRPYEIKFEPFPPCPSLLSDATSMADEIIWDHEGPFSRRAVPYLLFGGG